MMLRAPLPSASASANAEAVADRRYDLAFVGSGIACTLTRLALARFLLDAPRRAFPCAIFLSQREKTFVF